MKKHDGKLLSGHLGFANVDSIIPDGKVPAQTIAVEGSVLEHVRGGLFMMEDALRASQASYGFSRTESVLAEPAIVKNGPSVGAAIAAAMVTANQ